MSTETARTPAPVRYAYLLWIAALAIELVWTFVSEILAPTLIEPAQYRAILYVVVVLFVLAVLGAFAWFARRMREGRNWARIAMVVVLALALYGMRDFFDPVEGVLGVVSRVEGVVTRLMWLAAVVLTFVPAANPWFRQVR